jgi:hypothetical protein
MATTADIKNGMCIRFNHGLYSIVEFQHVKPGKGPAFVRTKLKNLTSGKVLDNTFTAGHKIEPVRVERRKYHMATYLLPKMIRESYMFSKLWITCNDYNIVIYHALTRLSEGKSAGLFSSWPPIYKNFKPLGVRLVNTVPQYVAEYSR